ncbi:MAG: phosphoribosyl-AMP cyclohydrolase [Eubacteriales bacterium]
MIVIDTETKQVLMMAYMSHESLQVSMEEGRTCFWSRSRKELWRKGETSGNVQQIVSIAADCDADTLLIEVRKSGIPRAILARKAASFSRSTKARPCWASEHGGSV